MNIVQIVTLIATLLVSGWVAAFITQALKRASWPSWTKLGLSMIVAALVGLATAWLSGDVTRFVTLWKSGGVTADQFLTFATLIWVSASTWYRFWLKDATWARTLGAWPTGATSVK